MHFTVLELPLDKFFSQLGVNCIKSQAKLNGSLAAETKGNDLILKQSALKFLVNNFPTRKHLYLK